MSFIRQRTAQIREKRLGSISAWYGSAGSLLREAELGVFAQRIRTYAQDADSDLIHALRLVGTLDQIAVVVHGPAGCAAALHSLRDLPPGWIVTNINERDSILGGDSKLRAAILDAHRRFAPRAIVVVASPVVIINNDDIDSVTEELNEELGLPIVPVYADGFRSKIGATGLDVVVHALVKHLLPAGAEEDDREQGEHVNLLSCSENRANLALLQAQLDELDIASQPFPAWLSVKDAPHVRRARLSVSVDAAESHYAALALEHAYGIDSVAAVAPIGIGGTSEWLQALARRLGREDQVARIVARESSRLQGRIEAASALRGRKVFINLPTEQAFGFWRLAGELGLEVVGIKVPFLDPTHASALREIVAGNEGLPILVGEGQAQEEVSLLRTANPDLYIGRGAASVHAARLGLAILVVDELAYLGFGGLENLVVQIERKLANTRFQRFLAEVENEPYTQSWRQKSAYWYIKHEVK